MPDVAGRLRRSATSDRPYQFVTRGVALVFGLVLAYFVWSVVHAAWPVLKQYNYHLITSSTFSVGNGPYGALTLILDTLITTAIALVIATPIGIGTALAILYTVPLRMRTALASIVELLAAVPSVVYGLWGVVVFNGLFKSVFHQTIGFSLFLAGLVLAIMILPTLVAISRDVLAVVPHDLTEGALSLGTTRSQTLTRVVIPTARTGLLGAIALGAGRALGETIAVAMVIGFNTYLPHSLFSTGATLASMIAVKFGEATTQDLSALACLALMLMVITAAVNAGARYLTSRATVAR
ncbi:MAG TPA: phosphate ABC transporter permease subunit PstC [Acidimicrobiales bacterium]|nr:phosphate ABC transporter permease subunit PstC [Acidimicrobiales bacterium]